MPSFCSGAGRLAALPVVNEDGKLLGIVTEDCIMADRSPQGVVFLTVGQVMIHEIASIDEDASFAELVENFSQDSATPIVVTRDGCPTGLAVPENLVVLGQKLTKENLAATVPFSPTSDYLVVPECYPTETACETTLVQTVT